MKKQLISLLMAFCAIASWAVPAKRTAYPATLPDGSTVMVHRVGSEHENYILDSDGHLMIPADKGGVAYAGFDLQGRLVRTDRPVKMDSAMLHQRQAKRLTAASPARVAQLGIFPGSAFPCTGEARGLVILVEFQDTKFKLGDDAHRYFNDLLNKEGFDEYGGTGCAADYFRDQSAGRFTPQFDVYGPVTLSQNAKYYGENDPKWDQDMRPDEMIIEACQLIDDEVDFSKYDFDHNGSIDNVFVFYAGLGEATASPSDPTSGDLIWPHQYSVLYYGKTVELDGVLIDNYACTNEWENTYSSSGKVTGGKPDGVGTFCHEFSHVLGLPDLYLTYEDELKAGESPYFTPGEWSILDYGPYNNDGRTPPSYSAFERNALGWLTSQELTSATGDYELSDIQASNFAYTISNPKNSAEFYLLESRKRTGWDAYIPADGMLLWHIDYNYDRWEQNTVNNKSSHQYVDLVEADGVATKTYRNGGDCYPGTKNVTKVTPKWWTNGSTGVNITDITLTADKGITFHVQGVGSGNDDPNEPGGDYLTVADVIGSAMTGEEATARGYIVGYVNSGSWSANGVKFGASTSAPQHNVILSDTPGETDLDKLIPVQLKTGSKARTDLNLCNNPSMLGKLVEVTGTLEPYCGTNALKNVATYTLIDTGSGEENALDELSTINYQPSTIYDLQGRRVSGAPAHGLYIINGRKVLR